MQNSNNIIMFPRKYTGPEPLTPEEIEESNDMMKYYHIQETISHLVPIIFNNLDIAGFYDDMDEEEDIDDLKEGAFVVEALRALMCKHYGLYHPFQDIWENVFTPSRTKYGEPMLKIVDELNVSLRKKHD